MITFPRNNETWQVTQGSEKKPDIIYTHNVQFDDEGRIGISPRTIEIVSSTDDADFQLPLAMTDNAGADGTVFTTDKVFDVAFKDTVSKFSLTELNPTFGEIPDGDRYGTIVQFNNKTHIIEDARILKYDGGSTPWSTTGITYSANTFHHPACEFKNRRTLVVGDGNVVRQYNTSYATTNLAQLTLPAGFEVIGIDYNAGLVGIATVNEYDQAYFFVWDGGSNEANYGFPVGARRCYWVKAYKNTFVTLTGKGQLLYWTSSGMDQLAALPVYYRYKASFEDYNNYTSSRERSVVVDGDIILFNIGTTLEIRTPEQYRYDTTTPSGVWCYDPNVGLYHRSALTATPSMQDNFLSLNSSEFTLNIDAPATGTELRISDTNGNLTGVDVNKLYYVIKTDTRKVKLAETYEDAITGTAVTLGGSIDNFTMLTMVQKNDFGQLEYDDGGLLFLFSANEAYPEFFIAGKSGYDIAGAFGYDNFVAPTALCENRGQVILEKMFSDTLKDTFETVYIKTSGLDASSKNKVVVKVKTEEYIPKVFDLVWTSGTQFTTTADLSDVSVKDEIVFTKGAGASYSAHITDITGNTVTIDETIENISASDEGTGFIDKFEKVATIAKGTSSEVKINKKAPWLLLKFELRGSGVTIEQVKVVNNQYK